MPFETEALAYRWMERIHQAIKPKPNFSDVFAFIHYAHKLDSLTTKGAIRTGKGRKGERGDKERVETEEGKEKWGEGEVGKQV